MILVAGMASAQGRRAGFRGVAPGLAPLGRFRFFLAAAVLWAATAGCRKSAPPPPPPPPMVTVVRPVEREVIVWDEYIGHLEAVKFVEVRARVGGLLESVPFVEGSIVKKGDLLFKIDVRPFQADLDSKLSDEAQAAAQVDLARIDFTRIESIPGDSRSQTEYDTAAAVLKRSEAVLAAAKANVESARLDVEWCRVTAPIAGRISSKYVTEGNMITGGSGTGTLLTTIASIDPIYCYVDTDEESVLKYQKLAREGKRASARESVVPCFLQLANEKGFPHEGVIDFVDNRLDPTTGTIRARGVFPNPQGWLTPGFFARLRVPGTGRYKTLLVPDLAVTTDQSEKQLLVVGPDGIVEARHVELGALIGDLRSIVQGIHLNDRIVVNGLLRARPGAKVSPHEEAISFEHFPQTSPGSATTQSLPSIELESSVDAPRAESHPTTTEKAR